MSLPPLLRRFLISGGYFGPSSSSSGSLTSEQAFLGRLLTIFQCGINYNQHGEIDSIALSIFVLNLRQATLGSTFELSTKRCSFRDILSILLFHYKCLGIYQAEGVIEAGKKLPIVDVGSAFYPNMVSLNILQQHVNTHCTTQVLFNHACCPNTLRINRGRVSYMVAKHTIMPGEEVKVSK